MTVGPTIRRRRLGADLRRLREAKALKLEDVALVLGVAPSTLSRIETGKAPTRTSYLTVMLDLYGVADDAERQALSALAREGQRRDWWAVADDLLPAGLGTYLGLEADASAVLAFQDQVVPGLLQTPAYAAAVVRATRPGLSPAQVDQMVEVQARRQQVLDRDDPPALRCVLDESVLLRWVGTGRVMREQLDRLTRAARHPAVTLRVLRLSFAGRPALSGPFCILEFPHPGDADVLCAESARGQVLMDERGSEVRAARTVFDQLAAAALTPPGSAELLAALAAEL